MKNIKVIQSYRIHNAKEHNRALIKFNNELQNCNSCPSQASKQHTTHRHTVAMSGTSGHCDVSPCACGHDTDCLNRTIRTNVFYSAALHKNKFLIKLLKIWEMTSYRCSDILRRPNISSININLIWCVSPINAETYVRMFNVGMSILRAAWKIISNSFINA